MLPATIDLNQLLKISFILQKSYEYKFVLLIIIGRFEIKSIEKTAYPDESGFLATSR